jgi:hypothetical protein
MEPCKKVLTSLLLLAITFLTGTGQDVVGEPCHARNKRTAERLGRDSPMFYFLKDSSVQPKRFELWRNELRMLGVRHVSAVVDIERRDGRLQLDIVKIEFLENYYIFEPVFWPTDARSIELATDLRKRLEWPVLAEANSMLAGMNLSPVVCGSLHVNLLDDECLPTPFFTDSNSFYINCEHPEILKTPHIKPTDSIRPM